jgi:succinate dehydrogenase / fumarate reductase, cytochrome b subunit
MAYRVLSSSVGKKLSMALTGLVLYGFLVGHLVGNLLLLKGDGGRAFNAYSEFLITHPLLVPVELFLLTTLCVHIYLAITVSLENRKARPAGYQNFRSAGGRTFASRTMIYTGILIFVFLVLHLKTFKYGESGGGTLYHLVSSTFQQTGYLIWYLFSMVVVGFHLYHAFHSAFQTLSLGGPKVKALGLFLSLALAAGFGFLPVYLSVLNK